MIARNFLRAALIALLSLLPIHSQASSCLKVSPTQQAEISEAIKTIIDGLADLAWKDNLNCFGDYSSYVTAGYNRSIWNGGLVPVQQRVESNTGSLGCELEKLNSNTENYHRIQRAGEQLKLALRKLNITDIPVPYSEWNRLSNWTGVPSRQDYVDSIRAVIGDFGYSMMMNSLAKAEIPDPTNYWNSKTGKPIPPLPYELENSDTLRGRYPDYPSSLHFPNARINLDAAYGSFNCD